MSRRQPKGLSLSIFLIKEDVATPVDCLMEPRALTTFNAAVNGRHIGELYIKPTTDKQPSWLSLFEGAAEIPLLNLHNASAAGVLLVAAGPRNFALTFGYGRSLLRPGTWGEDFGLRVTLNAVDPSRIRSVDRLKFDAISQHSQIQASRDANIIEFGLDVEQDLLRAVTGKPRDISLASQLTGKDALKADVHVKLGDIPDLLVRFWEISNQVTYREHFSFVDHVNEVKDPTIVQRLDDTLLERIQAREFERLWLAIPDRVEWEGMAGFKYRDGPRAAVHSDVHINAFLEGERDDFVASIKTLKNRRRIYLVSHQSDAVVSTWPLYRCIYCEIESGTETFLLNNGKWYRISRDFLGLVNDSFDEVTATTFQFPNYSHGDEAEYNEWVATTQADTFFLMDQKFIRYPTGRDPIEFCDLFTTSKLIVHVKKYRGSATLSHLFSQGVVSAELFCALPEFRHAVNDFLPDAFRFANPDQRPDSEEFEVVFAIISKSRRPLTVPFFSRVNLRNAAQRLKAFGYRVSVSKIQADDDTATDR